MSNNPDTAWAPTGVLPLVRQLREKLGDDDSGLPDLEAPAPIEDYVRLPSRKDVWPPEVWAEMEAIRKGELP